MSDFYSAKKECQIFKTSDNLVLLLCIANPRRTLNISFVIFNLFLSINIIILKVYTSSYLTTEALLMFINVISKGFWINDKTSSKTLDASINT